MARTRKSNITGATPSEILDMLLVYKDTISTPIDSFARVLSQLDPKKDHLFVIGVKNGQVLVQSADDESKKG